MHRVALSLVLLAAATTTASAQDWTPLAPLPQARQGAAGAALGESFYVLGGNSGSCVIDVKTGQVVALHFAGRYLDANFAVPMFELAKDGRVHDGGVAFGSTRPNTPTAWDGRWRAAWLDGICVCVGVAIAAADYGLHRSQQQQLPAV